MMKIGEPQVPLLATNTQKWSTAPSCVFSLHSLEMAFLVNGTPNHQNSPNLCQWVIINEDLAVESK
eukprot:scaffold43415_cov13-Tisochrysis_lutea.AAC.1